MQEHVALADAEGREPDVDPGRTLLAIALREDGTPDAEREEVVLRWLDLLPPRISLPLALRVKALHRRLGRLLGLMETRLVTQEFNANGGYVDREKGVAYAMEATRTWVVEDPEGLRAELFKAGLTRRFLDKAIPMRAVPNHSILNALMSDPTIPREARAAAQAVIREYRVRKYGTPHLVAYPMGEHHDAAADDDADPGGPEGQ